MYVEVPVEMLDDGSSAVRQTQLDLLSVVGLTRLPSFLNLPTDLDEGGVSISEAKKSFDFTGELKKVIMDPTMLPGSDSLTVTEDAHDDILQMAT